MKLKAFLLLFTFSVLLFSCKKEEVNPEINKLTSNQKRELAELIKLNPGTPIDVLIGVLMISDAGRDSGLTNKSNY